MADVEKTIQLQIEKWKRDLQNMSRSNRLIYLRPASVLEIDTPSCLDVYSELTGKHGLEVVAGEPELFEAPARRPAKTNQVRFRALAKGSVPTKLKSLERNASQTFMDKGVWVLYLGFGMLEWSDAPPETQSSESIFSPLLLVPVTVSRGSANEPFRIKRQADEEQKFNLSLRAALVDKFGLELQSGEEEEDLEPAALFQSIAKQVEQRKWKVHQRVVLSTFSFQKEPIVRDLEKNLEHVLASPAVRGLILRKDAAESFEFAPIAEEDIDEEAPPEQTVTIRDADATQRVAIAAAAEGRSFIMDGPPGTGKSQTIANMIADLLAKDRTVLFVSEKIAALDVVFSRLADSRIDEFVLKLHSHNATRKEVARALGGSLTKRLTVKAADAEAQVQQIKQRRAELSNYAIALNEMRLPLHRPLQHVLGEIASLQGLPQAPHPVCDPKALDPQAIDQVRMLAGQLENSWGPVARGKSFLWRDLKVVETDQKRRVHLQLLVEKVDDSLTAVVALGIEVAGAFKMPDPSSLVDVDRLHTIECLLLERPIGLPRWLSCESMDPHLNRLERVRREIGELDELEITIRTRAGEGWQALGVSGADALNHAVASVKRDGLHPPVSTDSTSENLSALRRSLQDAHVQAEALQDAMNEFSALVSTPAGTISPARARAWCSIVGLGSKLNQPEAIWLTAAGWDAASAAAEALTQPFGEVRKLEAELRLVFTRDVLELDLETLCYRFASAYTGFGKFFKRQFHADTRLLRSTTRSGEFRKTELDALPKALEWQAAERRCREVLAQVGAALGKFDRGLETNLEQLWEALGTAQEVIKLDGALSGAQRAALLGQPTRLSDEAHYGVEQARQAGERLAACDCPWADLDSRPLEVIKARIPACVERLQDVETRLSPIDLCAGRSVSCGTAGEILELRRAIHLRATALEEQRPSDTQLFGPLWAGRGTQFDQLEKGLRWAQRMLNANGAPFLSEAAERLAQLNAHTPRLGAAIAEATDGVGTLCGGFEEPRAQDYRDTLRGPADASHVFLMALIDSLDDLAEWQRYVEASRALVKAGFQKPLTFCVERHLDAKIVPGVLMRAMFELWADDILSSDPRLKTYESVSREKVVTSFRDLDREFVSRAARHTIEACCARRPKSVHGAGSIILNEAQKQKRHMQVHKLMAEAGEVIQAVKPCFMMSPLAVSQFIPPTMRFDVVIFDEASQVRPADAIASIYRGNALIIAGDQRQLPPTAFFERIGATDDDEYDEDTPDEFESILDLGKASGVFTSLPLLWHYRSKHEDLIAFSNRWLYNKRLVTFPGATERAPDLGVEHFFCENGVYRRGTSRDNLAEAAMVAERVLFHVMNHPDRSIGVVAFSEAQAQAVESELDRAAEQNPALKKARTGDRLNHLFVKNLESVQGDERDIIIFSMGYGADENGKFTMNFGPLTKSGGERRLNVAITRARRKVEFVSSVRARQFSEVDGGSAYLLRYLEYAEDAQGRRALLAMGDESSSGEVESPFEDEVQRVIQSWGYEAVPQVGCLGYRVDLGVKVKTDATRFVLGVECDGAMYHSSRAARDRDRLRQEVLEGLGWRLHRIWGPSWYKGRRAEEERLKKAIEAAIAAGGRVWAPPAVKEPALRVVEQTHNPQSAGRPSWASVYTAADVPDCSQLTSIADARSQSALCDIILRVVRREGPVTESRILERAKAAFGVARAGSRIQEAFNSALASVKRREGALEHRGGVLWMQGAGVAVRIPDPDEPLTKRGIEDVPKQELELALLNTVMDALQISEAELTVVVARLFGWERTGPQIGSKLASVLNALVKRGRLLRSEGRLTPGTDPTAAA